MLPLCWSREPIRCGGAADAGLVHFYCRPGMVWRVDYGR